MSGNYGPPRASDSPFSPHRTADRIIRDILGSARSPDDISPSGELYRTLERYHRARGTQPPAISNSHAMSSDSDRDNRQGVERGTVDPSPIFVLPTEGRTLRIGQRSSERGNARAAAASARRGRPRLTPSDRYLERGRLEEASRNNASILESWTEHGRPNAMQDGTRQLEAANSTSRALLDNFLPDLSFPNHDDEQSGENGQYRRVKRRKLESDKVDSSFVRYGHFGQVEPGPLKMEIATCDGGIFEERGGVNNNYAAENVLRSDSTVYCTKSNRCNLVLRHQGATVFSLTELIIKAPHSGYTAPVQEGMVFISMTSDDLLTRTAQYQIQYSPARIRRATSIRSSELPPIMSIRHNGEGGVMSADAQARARARRLYEIGQQDDECDLRTAQIPSDFTTTGPPFQVTTELSDSDDDDDESITRRLHRRRSPHRSLNHILGISFDPALSDDDNEQSNNAWNEDYLQGQNQNRSPPRSPRLRRRETASNILLSDVADALSQASEATPNTTPEGGELMAPHARFFIERDKSKCTVTFDPPVSGRFILLKMWSPHHSPTGNIDIQSVVAKGFAGPRFFPSIDLR